MIQKKHAANNDNTSIRTIIFSLLSNMFIDRKVHDKNKLIMTMKWRTARNES